ncbi:hypothetical protein B5E84_13745 [Lachnoclostridium sp. An14]|uniref:DUF4097 family beta strand repeat-containing protein n=1 Tax=Lachnoclostridium sp. An14 TaxID=1965562 RepID=UPI000B37EBD9|nr:DUF4097 family beta strand repeat-containing protein [Lachnoclostridium sp. An14]OUQ15889.1 hypothetical protein B5E84_13745 [Lachnoclostridium sp. An14]
MKKFAIVTSIVGIVCIVAGVIVVTVASVSGASVWNVVENGPSYAYNSSWVELEDSAGNIEDISEYSYEGITELELDVGNMALAVRERDGDDGSILVRLLDPNNTVFCETDDAGTKLTIWSDPDMARVSLKDGARRFLKDGKDTAQVELLVPAGYRFQSVDMDLGAGYLTADVLRAEDVELTVGAGAAEIKTVDAGTLETDVGVGYLKIDRAAAARSLSADCGVGSTEITLEGRKEDFDSVVECAMGTIVLDGDKHEGAFSSENGGFGFPQGGSKELKLDCGIGMIKIDFVE